MKFILALILALAVMGCATDQGPTTNTLGYEGTQVFPEMDWYRLHVVELEGGKYICVVPQYRGFFQSPECFMGKE